MSELDSVGCTHRLAMDARVQQKSKKASVEFRVKNIAYFVIYELCAVIPL